MLKAKCVIFAPPVAPRNDCLLTGFPKSQSLPLSHIVKLTPLVEPKYYLLNRHDVVFFGPMKCQKRYFTVTYCTFSLRYHSQCYFSIVYILLKYLLIN